MDIAAVLTVLYPGAVWGVTNNDYSTLRWDESNSDPMPTLEMLEAAWPQVQYEREYAQVELARRARYQSETDGMFFAAQRDGGDMTEWQAAVDAIKADLPYPTPPDV